MIGKLKIMGLALVAVLAMSAVAASGAQAAGKLTSATSPVTLEGSTGIGSGEKFDAFGASVECETSKYHTPLTATPAERLTVEPQYGPLCTATGNLRATVTLNGCDFEIYNAIVFTPGHYHVTTDIVCPAGKEIEIHIYGSLALHNEKKALCTLKIPPQVGLEGLDVTDVHPNLVLEGEVVGIHATQERNSILCPSGTSTTTAKQTVPGVTVGGKTSGGAADTVEISG